MSAPEWIEYTGSDGQIGEINASESFLLKRKDGEISFILQPPFEPNEMDSETIAEYLICQPHPYADLIDMWRISGCPVWVRSNNLCYEDNNSNVWERFGLYVTSTTKPNWNIPGAEYSLTPFED